MLLLSRNVSILDGGFSAPLEEENLLIQGDPLWSARILITNPKKVLDVHKRYLAAGAQVIETSSYQAAIPTLKAEFGNDSQEKCEELVRNSARLARQAIAEFCQETGQKPEKFLVAGSIGPYATVLHDGSEYSGHYIDKTPREEVISYFQGQANALLQAGVDLLAFETIPSLAEAKLILQVIDSCRPPFAWISFTCRDGTSTQVGDDFAEVASILSANPGVSMIGINCTPPEHVSSLLKRAAHSKKPFVIYPNSGEKWKSESGWHRANQHVEVSTCVPGWISQGAKVIGGCCRIGPDGIKEIAKVVSQLCNSAKN